MPFLLKDLFQKEEHLLFLQDMEYDPEDAIEQINPKTNGFILHDAASSGQIEMVSILLTKGKMDINMSHPALHSEGETPLTTALAAGCSEMASFLINSGASCTKPDKSGEFPLVKAIRRENHDNLLKLLQSGANIDQENLVNSAAVTRQNLYGQRLPYTHMTALMYASYLGSRESMTLLIEHGAASTNSQGRTFLEYALHPGVIKAANEEIEKQKSHTTQLHSTLANIFPSEDLVKTVCSYTAGCSYLNNGFFKTKKRPSHVLSTDTKRETFSSSSQVTKRITPLLS